MKMSHKCAVFLELGWRKERQVRQATINIKDISKIIRHETTVGKEVHATTRQFTIIISGSNVEKHDVSLCLKFQGNRFNILEITAVFVYDKKNEKQTVFFSILSLNLPPIKISYF